MSFIIPLNYKNVGHYIRNVGMRSVVQSSSEINLIQFLIINTCTNNFCLLLTGVRF